MAVRALAAALLACIALSGCLAGKDGESSSGTTSPQTSAGTTSDAAGSRTTTSGGTSGDSTQAPANLPPTASLNVTVSGLRANVTLQGRDPEGAPVNWTLAFGDGAFANGTVLPANRTHLYAAAGTYNLTLTVQDGRLNTTARAVATLAGAAGQPVLVTGSAQFPCPQCTEVGANTGVGYRAGESGLDSFFTAVGPELANRAFTLSSTGGDPELSFRDSCDGGAAIGEPFNADGPESGTVPEGAACILVWEYEEAGSEFTLTVT